MKDIFILVVSLLALVFFTSCTTGVNRLKTEKEWTKFVGKEVQQVKTTYREMIMETLTSLKNTLEEAFAGATNPSNNLA